MMKPNLRAVGESTRFLWVLLVAGLLVILYFGLKSKGFDSRNDVAWLEEGNGLAFHGHGIAYSEPLFTRAEFPPEMGMTIELALRAHRPFEKKFQFTIEIDAGATESHLVIGQWKDEIIVLQGDDYDYHRRVPRVAIPIEAGREEVFLTVVSGAAGTKLYLDGTVKVGNPDLVLSIPDGEPARLIVGNSTTGLHGWKGEVRGLAIHATALNSADVKSRATGFRESGGFQAGDSSITRVQYSFREGEGEESSDEGGRAVDLSFPDDKSFLTSSPFWSDPDGWKLGWRDREDVVLNFAGFVPFGLVLAALLGKKRRWVMTLLLAGGIGFILSLTIETMQAWMPSRTSSVLDLTLNTAGTILGALCYHCGIKQLIIRVPEDAAERE